VGRQVHGGRGLHGGEYSVPEELEILLSLHAICRFTGDGAYMAVAEPADFVHIYDVAADFKRQQVPHGRFGWARKPVVRGRGHGFCDAARPELRPDPSCGPTRVAARSELRPGPSCGPTRVAARPKLRPDLSRGPIRVAARPELRPDPYCGPDSV
jgi:hypothetical protein